MFIRFLLIPLFLINILGFPKQNISLSAKSAIIMDPWTKKVFYSKNPHLELSPASTAKIMTALIVLEKSYPNKEVVVSKFASLVEPSKIYIKEGERYLTIDLLKALLLNSANDTSVALAESIAGSEKKFVDMMNERASSLGAKNTNFRNSNGLPAKNQYSTAYDLSIIVREAMKNKNIVDIMKMKTAEIEELTSGRRIKLRNHNKSLWKEKPYLLLGKTGYTKKAKHCFAGYIQYNRLHKAIVVLLKGDKLWSNLEVLSERGN